MPVHSVPKPSGRTLRGDLLHGGERLARAVARGGAAVHLGRGVEVVVRHVDRADGVPDVAQRARGGPGRPCGSGPRGSGCPRRLVRTLPSAWTIHLPDLAVKVEVVDVVAAEVGLERREDVGDRHVQVAGPWSRSRSNLSWGTRAEKVEKTPASSGRLRASSRNRSTTSASASTPFPRDPRS